MWPYLSVISFRVCYSELLVVLYIYNELLVVLYIIVSC